MHDGNVLSDPTHEKMHDGNNLTDPSRGIGWQCPLHYICFHFDTNMFVLCLNIIFKKNNFFNFKLFILIF